MTGTSIRGIIKAEVIVFPVVMVASLLFSQFICRLAPITSSNYPQGPGAMAPARPKHPAHADLDPGRKLPFLPSLKRDLCPLGIGFGVITYGILSLLGLPILLVYGVVRGLGQSTPHGLILEVVGALVGRFFFFKRYGAMWRQYAPVLLAGFSCSMGLTGMFAMGFALILKSLGRLAY